MTYNIILLIFWISLVCSNTVVLMLTDSEQKELFYSRLISVLLSICGLIFVIELSTF